MTQGRMQRWENSRTQPRKTTTFCLPSLPFCPPSPPFHALPPPTITIIKNSMRPTTVLTHLFPENGLSGFCLMNLTLTSCNIFFSVLVAERQSSSDSCVAKPNTNADFNTPTQHKYLLVNQTTNPSGDGCV